MKLHHRSFFAILFFVSLTVFIFYRVIFFGEVFYYGDNFHLNAPLKSIFIEQISKGQFPLWNPYIFIGTPYFADLNLGTLFPLNIFYFIFDVYKALTFQAVMDIFLIAVFTYFFLRSLNMNYVSSTLGAIIFAFNGQTFSYINNIAILNVVIFIPLIFYLSNKFITSKNFRHLHLLIIVQTIQFISGHPQITFYTIFFNIIFLFFLSNFHLKTRLLIALYYLSFPVILASVQLIPFLEFVNLANRPVSGFAYSSFGSLPFWGFITFLFPTIFGSIADGNWWGPQQVLIGYMGISSLFLVFIGIRNWRSKYKLFFTITLILAIILSLGRNTFLYDLFYNLVPGWKYFRIPSQILIFFVFFASILSAGGLDFIIKEKISVKKFIFPVKKILFLLTVTFFFGLLLYAYTSQQFFWKRLLENLSTKIDIFNGLLIYDESKLQIMLQNIFMNFLTFALLLFLTLLLMSKYRKVKTGLLLITLVSLNLLYFDTKVLLTTNSDLYKIKSGTEDIEKVNYRILSLPVKSEHNRAFLPGSDFFYNEAKINLKINNSDSNITNKFYQVRGYASLVPGDFASFVDSKNYRQNITGVNLNIFDINKLNNLSIKWIFSNTKIPGNLESKLKLVNKDGYYLYLNNTAFPRAYLLTKNPKDEIKILEEKNESIKIKVNSDKKNKLILTDQFYPGWEAYAGNKEIPINPYLKTFRSVSVNRGESIITFKYSPASFYIGFFVTIVSFLIWLTLFILKKDYIFNIRK